MLDHLEESIIILSEDNIDFINDKCLELLDPIISKFKIDFKNGAIQGSPSRQKETDKKTTRIKRFI